MFTSLISRRLIGYIENFELLGEEQAGFRKQHSTVDHLLVLYSLIELYVKDKKKLYCSFIDYSKAFDTVPHVHLWTKLLATGINGKIFNVVKAMYESAKSYVRQGNCKGFSFNCEIGVRQGENLSPLLFALYLNDLESFLSKAFNGLKRVDHMLQEFTQTDDIIVYLRLFTILYADDTVILAESGTELQAALNGMHHYCQIWKLKINTSKTKVVVFGAKPDKIKETFKLGDMHLNVVSEYEYLGMSFKYNGNLAPGIVKIRDQASRAMYALIAKSRKLGLSIDVQLYLFDTLVIPVALYGSEVWGFKNVDIVEQLHLKYMRMLLKVNNSTPKCMLYGELGRLPLKYNVELRMINFWYRLISGNKRKISYNMYQLLFKLDDFGVYHSEWITKLKEIIQKCNLYDKCWIEQENQDLFSEISLDMFKTKAKNNLRQWYEHSWRNDVQNSSKCIFYKEFKQELKIEKYLLILDHPDRINLTKFRLSNHKLPVEIGRHNNIIRKERLCEFCDKNDIGDEYHYFFSCSKFMQEINKLIPKNCIKHPSVKGFCDLLATNSSNTMRKLATMCKIIMSCFK